ncbi:MAG: LPP20 family lipoprotein [Pseudomonadota bacterium]|jgi:hypothetical protein|nr:hypothetical protein [Porticoccaceae bacterium]MEC7455349.1 LPP20 family lipoprotein [Pseudomonadota bacterium]MBE64366.1 hypothetical protein [Porticoccaceae bacterium]MEC8212740.1 LPP20 family lipoprotein [Pseudomonadota bacterium]MEC8499384.1 LPP20 family lipoprotein [Pseudomonadota bacterium]|tara:strand:- start:450 stop:956 length:507 start_codon:yes stop_codon:yes gene_type:complete
MKPIKNFFSFLHKNSVSGFITMLLVMTTGCAVNMQDYNAALVQSVLDRNNNIIATGYAVISVQKADTPAQQRILSIKASKLDAYKVLMEQVYGQYLDANTTVSEMIVQSDTFRAKVQGVIYGAKLVSITPVGDDTYETTLSLSNSVVDDLRKLYLASMTSQGSFITGS